MKFRMKDKFPELLAREERHWAAYLEYETILMTVFVIDIVDRDLNDTTHT